MPEWVSTLLSDISALQLVLWVVAIFALVGVVVKAWPLITNLVVVVNALVALPAFIERTDDRLEGVHHETHKNDGSSIKDSTVRLEEAVERIELGVKGLYDRTDALAAADDQLREDIENTKPKEKP